MRPLNGGTAISWRRLALDGRLGLVRAAFTGFKAPTTATRQDSSKLASGPRAIPGASLPGRSGHELGTLSFSCEGFQGLSLRIGPCGLAPPSYMRHTVAISRVCDRLGVWIGAP